MKDSKRHVSMREVIACMHVSAGPGHREESSLATQFHHFLASLTKSRGFYANLAESLCSDESFAETRDTADCWNGQRIGE